MRADSERVGRDGEINDSMVGTDMPFLCYLRVGIHEVYGWNTRLRPSIDQDPASFPFGTSFRNGFAMKGFH